MDLISLKPSTYDFRNEMQAQLARVNSTRYGLRGCRHEAVRIWNSPQKSLNLILSSGEWSRLRTGSTVNVPFVLPEFYFCSVQFSFPCNFLLYFFCSYVSGFCSKFILIQNANFLIP